MKLFYLLGMLSAFHALYAGGDPQPAGARTWGIGGTSLTLRDPYALFNNPAGLSGLKSFHAMACYDRRFEHAGFQTFSAGLALPLHLEKKDTTRGIGLGFQRFGDELYNESQMSLAVAQRIGLVSLGLKLNFLQLGFGELGVRRLLTLELGGQATLIPEKLFFGAYIYNLTQAKIADYQDERVPVLLRSGFSYRPLPTLMLNAELEKDIDFQAAFRAGMEYEIVHHFQLRTGISTRPSVSYFGIGFNPGKIQVDYALRTHPQLGLSHHLSIVFRIEQVKLQLTKPERS
jgi:hypothetical protein